MKIKFHSQLIRWTFDSRGKSLQKTAYEIEIERFFFYFEIYGIFWDFLGLMGFIVIYEITRLFLEIYGFFLVFDTWR